MQLVHSEAGFEIGLRSIGFNSLVHLPISIFFSSSIPLSNTHGVTMEVVTAGASITSLTMPGEFLMIDYFQQLDSPPLAHADRNGKSEDVVLGLPTAADYMTNGPFMGCVVGRTCGFCDVATGVPQLSPIPSAPKLDESAAALCT